jgi:hypothetical protein
VLVARIVIRIHVVHAQRADRRHLRDILARFRPVEVTGIAGQNDDGTRRISDKLVGIEPIAQTDIEDA